MRTINPILKAACQSGQGLPIASAVVTSLADPPLDDQTYTIIKYKMDGMKLAATVSGSEMPNYGTIAITRGYEIGGIQYTENLPPFFIVRIKETSGGDFEIEADSFPTTKMTDAGWYPAYTMGDTIRLYASRNYISIDTPEETDPDSIFNGTTLSDASNYYNIKQLIYSVVGWPFIRFYQSETGLKAMTAQLDDTNIEINIIHARRIADFELIITEYIYTAMGGGTTNFDFAPYLNNQDRIDSTSILPLYFDPTGRTPDFEETIAKYYNEKENAALFFLLADMEIESGDRFSHNGYDWRIEAIEETFGNQFTQELYCLRIGETPIPYYLLLENTDRILLESGDDILME